MKEERIIELIRAETKGGYLEYWDESRELLSPEQQDDYFKGLAQLILDTRQPELTVIPYDSIHFRGWNVHISEATKKHIFESIAQAQLEHTKEELGIDTLQVSDN